MSGAESKDMESDAIEDRVMKLTASRVEAAESVALRDNSSDDVLVVVDSFTATTRATPLAAPNGTLAAQPHDSSQHADLPATTAKSFESPINELSPPENKTNEEIIELGIFMSATSTLNQEFSTLEHHKKPESKEPGCDAVVQLPVSNMEPTAQECGKSREQLKQTIELLCDDIKHMRLEATSMAKKTAKLRAAAAEKLREEDALLKQLNDTQRELFGQHAKETNNQTLHSKVIIELQNIKDQLIDKSSADKTTHAMILKHCGGIEKATNKSNAKLTSLSKKVAEGCTASTKLVDVKKKLSDKKFEVMRAEIEAKQL
ncbi:hypothetical protein B0J14DRAFT_686257 [Halenospora varia]|nr:hypothetical protein B0J14DRAFT_686257 [Halenospora varia]